MSFSTGLYGIIHVCSADADSLTNTALGIIACATGPMSAIMSSCLCCCAPKEMCIPKGLIFGIGFGLIGMGLGIGTLVKGSNC